MKDVESVTAIVEAERSNVDTTRRGAAKFTTSPSRRGHPSPTGPSGRAQRARKENRRAKEARGELDYTIEG